MARLAVEWTDGKSDLVELSHRRPVSVGSHSVSDIVVDDANVAALAARISWNGSSYEIIGASDDRILMNGKAVQRADLEHEDLIEIGGTRIVLERGSKKRFARKSQERVAEANAAAAAEREAASDAPAEPPKRDADPDAADDPAAGGSDNFADVDLAGGALDDDFFDDEYEVVDRDTKSRIRSRLTEKKRRPGQQQVTRSPTVVGLAILVVVLFVSTAALALFLRGKSIEQQFQDAIAAQEAGRYPEAIRKFDRFIESHPVHPLSDDAQWRLAFARVDQIVRRGSPDWRAGLQELNLVIREFRDDEVFAGLSPEIADRAGIVALGAASDAGRTRDRELVSLSEQAESLLTNYSPDSIPPRSLLSKIDEARQTSRVRLVQLDVRDEFQGRMQQFAENKQHLDVLATWRRFQAADAEMANEREPQALLTTAIDAVRSAVQPLSAAAEDTETEATPELPQYVSAFVAALSRPAGESSPSGEPILTWADDAYFANDSGTGELIWVRRFPHSFEPVRVSVPQAGLLAYNGMRHALEICDPRSGETQKVIPLPKSDGPPRRPSVQGATVFLPMGPELHRIDLSSETETASVTVGQSILPEPVLIEVAGASFVIAIGEAETGYVLQAGSLELQAMPLLGQSPGQVACQPVATAEFLVVPVNRPERDACELKMYRIDVADDGQATLSLASQATIDGMVVDSPALRGRDLFVSSTKQKVTVVSLSEAEGGGLTIGPSFAIGRPSDARVPVFLTPLADQEFWLAGRTLRRLRATPESIRPTGPPVPLGVPVSAPKPFDNAVYSAGRRGGGSTVTLTRVHEEDFTERWQVRFASDVVAIIGGTGSGPVAVVNEAGDVARVDLNELITTSTGSESLGRPPQSAVTIGDRLWAVTSEEAVSITPAGRIVKRLRLPAAPVAPITSWGERLVIPIKGQLLALATSGGPNLPPYWADPAIENPAGWRHVASVDAERLAALDDRELLHVVSRVETPSPHLAELAKVSCPGAVSFCVVDQAIVVNFEDRLVTYDSRSLAPDEDKTIRAGAGGRVEHLVGFTTGFVASVANGRQSRIISSDGRWNETIDETVRGLSDLGDGRFCVLTDNAVLIGTTTGEPERQLYQLSAEPTGKVWMLQGRLMIPTVDGAILSFEP